eukprot:618981-Amphidinium_carterae.2
MEHACCFEPQIGFRVWAVRTFKLRDALLEEQHVPQKYAAKRWVPSNHGHSRAQLCYNLTKYCLRVHIIKECTSSQNQSTQ